MTTGSNPPGWVDRLGNSTPCRNSTPSDQDGLINDHLVGWVKAQNPIAARLVVIELGFVKLNPTYGTRPPGWVDRLGNGIRWGYSKDLPHKVDRRCVTPVDRFSSDRWIVHRHFFYLA